MRLAFDLNRYVAKVRAFDGARFEVATEASVLHRGRAHPVLSVRSRAPASKTLLVLAGVHGDERGGAALRMKATIAYSEDREVPEIVLEGSSRLADEAARIRPHVDLVAALADRELV